MANYDLYGFASDDIEVAKELLEKIFEIRFEPHESDYEGGNYYLWVDPSGEQLKLKPNLDLFDDEPAERSYPNYKILLYVDETMRSKSLQGKLAQDAKDFILLRSK